MSPSSPGLSSQLCQGSFVFRIVPDAQFRKQKASLAFLGTAWLASQVMQREQHGSGLLGAESRFPCACPWEPWAHPHPQSLGAPSLTSGSIVIRMCERGSAVLRGIPELPQLLAAVSSRSCLMNSAPQLRSSGLWWVPIPVLQSGGLPGQRARQL